MASQAMVKQEQWRVVRQDLTNNLRSLAAAFPVSLAAGGADMKARATRAMRVALTQLDRNDSLLDCTRASIIGSVIQACQLGLELDGVMGQAYLVKYRDQCQMQIGYRGYTALAIRSGLVERIWPTLVYSNEPFKVGAGDTPGIQHERILDDVKRGEICAVYATAQFTSGRLAHHPMTMGEVAKREKVSKATSASAPWKMWREEMIKKTAVRGLCKHLDQCVDLQRAAVHDEYVESGHAPKHPTFEDVAAVEVTAEVTPDDHKPIHDDQPEPPPREPGQEG